MAIPDVRTPGLGQSSARNSPLRKAPAWKKNNNNNNNNFLLSVGKNQESFKGLGVSSCLEMEARGKSVLDFCQNIWFKVKLIATFYCCICWKEPRPGDWHQVVKNCNQTSFKTKNCPVPTLELQHRPCLVCYVVWGAGFASLLMHDVWVRTSQLTFQSSSYISQRPTRTLNTLQWNSHSLPLQARIPLISLSRGARLSHCLVTD